MPTIIDSLIVTLGLDPSDFDKGRKQAASDFLKTKEEAIKAAKEIEARGKQAAQFFSELRTQVIALYAVFTAGRGLKEFISDITRSDAETGRFAKTLDISTDELSAWQGLAKSAGGTAQGITSSMQSLVQQFQQFSLTGESSAIPYFRALGINISDAAGKMKPVPEILLELSDKLTALNDPAKALAFAQGLGINQETLNLLLKGRTALEALLVEQRKLGVESEADRKAAEAREKVWNDLMTAWKKVGETLLTTLTPALVTITEALKEFALWAQEHPEIVEAAFWAITAAVLALSAAMTVSLAGGAIKTVITAIGLLFTPLTGLIRLFPSLMLLLATLTETALPALSGAFLAVGAAIEATPVGWIITAIALLGGAAYELYEHWSAIKNWWHGLWGGMANDVDSSSKKMSSSRKQSSFPMAARKPGASDVDKLMAMGWTREQAIGIAANLQRESGGNAGAIGDNGAAFGLAQWHPDRQRAFARFAGHSIQTSTRDEQLAFIDYELRRGEDAGARGAGKALANATNAEDAAAIISRLYERPGRADEAGIRATLAGVMARAPAATLATGQTASSVVNRSNSSTVTSTRETNIGQIVVNTKATDAKGIAQDIGPAIENNTFAQQANYGAN